MCDADSLANVVAAGTRRLAHVTGHLNKEYKMGKDPVMADLDRYLDSLEEDFVDEFDRKRERDEYLADQNDSSEE